MTTERAAHFTFGPRFFSEGDQIMFEFAIDGSNKIGPRPATDADKAKHPKAWAAFEAGDEPTEQSAPVDTRPPAEAIVNPEIIEQAKARERARRKPKKKSAAKPAEQ